MVKKHKSNKSYHDGDLNEWVADLARRASGGSSTTTKDERIQKRQAKKQRREGRKHKKNKINMRDASSTSRGTSDGVFGQHEPASPNRRTADEIISKWRNSPQEKTNRMLRVLSKRVQECLESKTAGERGEKKKRLKPYTGGGAPASKRKKRQLADVLQPRRSDYGGIGLARESLYIDLQDPSCAPQLEREFAEHIPGFFGKQRTKTMKKQLEGNMLWRQLLKRKEQESAGSFDCSKKSKKFKGLSPDERVEAVLKSGAI